MADGRNLEKLKTAIFQQRFNFQLRNNSSLLKCVWPLLKCRNTKPKWMPLRPTGIQVHIRLARLVCKLRLALRLGRLVLLRHRNTTTTVLILMFRCVDWRAQVVKMLAVVVAMFATLWLPYRSYVVYNSFARERYENRWFLLFCRLAVYANSAVNPILYNAMSAKFRSAFRAQLSCSCRTYTYTYKTSCFFEFHIRFFT